MTEDEKAKLVEEREKYRALAIKHMKKSRELRQMHRQEEILYQNFRSRYEELDRKIMMEQRTILNLNGQTEDDNISLVMKMDKAQMSNLAERLKKMMDDSIIADQNLLRERLEEDD